jgi:hypothetical protein
MKRSINFQDDYKFLRKNTGDGDGYGDYGDGYYGYSYYGCVNSFGKYDYGDGKDYASRDGEGAGNGYGFNDGGGNGFGDGNFGDGKDI